MNIDECVENTNDCDENAYCIDTIGSFECLCNSGFTGSGQVCADVDECALQINNCHSNGACSNTFGSFLCACKTGYYGNGTSCENINECQEIPCGSNATCTDTEGIVDLFIDMH